MANSGDQMSAVFGVESVPMSISVPDGLYNSQFNTTWNASGITDVFLAFFPELADDSYATIGLTGPASASALADAQDPAMVQDAAQPFTPVSSRTGQLTWRSTPTGASWYNLNTASNTLPDANNEVLIMQLTTTGTYLERSTCKCCDWNWKRCPKNIPLRRCRIVRCGRRWKCMRLRRQRERCAWSMWRGLRLRCQ